MEETQVIASGEISIKKQITFPIDVTELSTKTTIAISAKFLNLFSFSKLHKATKYNNLYTIENIILCGKLGKFGMGTKFEYGLIWSSCDVSDICVELFLTKHNNKDNKNACSLSRSDLIFYMEKCLISPVRFDFQSYIRSENKYNEYNHHVIKNLKLLENYSNNSHNHKKNSIFEHCILEPISTDNPFSIVRIDCYSTDDDYANKNEPSLSLYLQRFIDDISVLYSE